MRKRDKRKTMKGGFFESLSNLGNSISQGTSDLWKKTSQGTSDLWEKTKNFTSNITSSNSQPTTSSVSMGYGGRRTRRRRMRGGFVNNTPLTGVAKNASSFSGPTDQPHNWVGGKTKKHRKKSRKHRKH